MKGLLVVLFFSLLITGCAHDIDSFPIKIGQHTKIINALKYPIQMEYLSTWGRQRVINLEPGQSVMVGGLGEGEYMTGKVFHEGKLIGLTMSYQIKKSRRGPQLIEIKSYSPLRG